MHDERDHAQCKTTGVTGVKAHEHTQQKTLIANFMNTMMVQTK